MLVEIFFINFLGQAAKTGSGSWREGRAFLNMIKSCLSFISCTFYIVLGKIVLFGSLKEFLKKLNFF